MPSSTALKLISTWNPADINNVRASSHKETFNFLTVDVIDKCQNNLLPKTVIKLKGVFLAGSRGLGTVKFKVKTCCVKVTGVADPSLLKING